MYPQEIMAIGELMEIKINNGFVKTKLQDLHQDGWFTVFHPTVKGLPIMLETDETYMLRFYRSNGIFSFEAVLLDWYKQDEIMLCLFEPRSEVVKSQRRQSYRLPIVIDVLIRLEDTEDGKSPAVKAKTVDLSEHGTLVTSFTKIEEGTKISVELRLSPVDSITLKAKVLRCGKPVEKKDPYRIVLLFEDNAKQHRSELGRYILQQQIAARKKKNQEVIP